MTEPALIILLSRPEKVKPDYEGWTETIELKSRKVRMPRNTMKNMQKSIESSKLRSQKRRDAQDLRNPGIYSNGRDHYLDEDGHPRDSIEIPTWFLNLSKAWESNKRTAAQSRGKNPPSIAPVISTADIWNQWCDNRVDMLGEECDPRKPKRKPGRPKLKASQRSQPKLKRSDQMRQLLENNGITLVEKESPNGPWMDFYLKQYPRVPVSSKRTFTLWFCDSISASLSSKPCWQIDSFLTSVQSSIKRRMV